MLTEDRFTPPTQWCPNPQFWTADDADATEHEVTELAAAFVRALQPGLAVELGSYLGQTSEAIGRALARNGHGVLLTIEIDPVRAERTRQRCAGLPVTVIVGDSQEWDMPGGIGFAWVDNGITRGADIARMLRRGVFTAYAVIGMHDAGPQHPFTAQVQPLVEAGQLRPIILHTPRGVMFAEVRAR